MKLTPWLCNSGRFISRAMRHQNASSKESMLLGLPHRGTVGAHLIEIAKHRAAGNQLNIQDEDMREIEEANSLLFDLGYADSLKVYAMLKPGRYRFAFEVLLPHTLQLKESVWGSESGSTRNTSDQVARKYICKQLMIYLLGDENFAQESKRYQSTVDMLYAYSHKKGLPSPKVFVKNTHKLAPRKSTAILSSLLVPDEAVVSLRGRTHVQYGPAMASTCSLATRLLKVLDIEKTCSHDNIISDTR